METPQRPVVHEVNAHRAPITSATGQRSGAEAPEESLTEETDQNAQDVPADTAGLTRRSTTRSVARRSTAVKPRRRAALFTRTPKTKTTAKAHNGRPFRSLAILTVVGGLIVTVALPAYGVWQPTEDVTTIQQVAADDAQSLVVASDATGSELERDSYSATTQKEIDEKKAKEAAAAAAAARAQLATSSSSGVSSVNLSMVAPGSGAVRYPVTNFSYQWESNGFQTASRPTHNGLDMMTSYGTPIFAAAAGVVRTSTNNGGTYGGLIIIDHVINGQQVSTLYAHVIYGSQVVSPGQTVSAGQVIAQVGQTGFATAPHCHFEVHLGGTPINPLAWLQANAG